MNKNQSVDKILKEFEDNFRIHMDWVEFNIAGKKPEFRKNLKSFIEKSYLAGKEDEKKRVVEMMEKYITENRHKVERIDRYVLDEIITHLKQSIIK